MKLEKSALLNMQPVLNVQQRCLVLPDRQNVVNVERENSVLLDLQVQYNIIMNVKKESSVLLDPQIVPNVMRVHNQTLVSLDITD